KTPACNARKGQKPKDDGRLHDLNTSTSPTRRKFSCLFSVALSVSLRIAPGLAGATDTFLSVLPDFESIERPAKSSQQSQPVLPSFRAVRVFNSPLSLGHLPRR
ncbi:hypothetical protein, partial [Paraburkholderia sp. EG304]|uniref:hypothetical protein n=1 Tax=Paraburkholderia sp. EG304 TaxID=3237015 RepID=UPI00397B0AE1